MKRHHLVYQSADMSLWAMDIYFDEQSYRDDPEAYFLSFKDRLPAGSEPVRVESYQDDNDRFCEFRVYPVSLKF